MGKNFQSYILAVDFPTWKESSFFFFLILFICKARASDQENHNRRSSCDNSLEDTKKPPQAENGEIDFDSAKGVQRMARGRCCTQHDIDTCQLCQLCYGGPTLPPNWCLDAPPIR